jgi:hypothetical protein
MSDLISKIRIKLGALKNIMRNFITSTMARIGTRGVVLSGPFKGVKLSSTIAFGTSGGNLAAKLLGTYEVELHDVVREIVASKPKVIINVGAGDGYYVCGFAASLPECRLIAYEADALSRDACARNLAINRLESITKIGGFATTDTLLDLLESEQPCLVIDCEGGELDLLDVEKLPSLRFATILVEIHDFVCPEIGSTISKRLEKTHTMRRINQELRPISVLGLPDWLAPWSFFLQNERRCVAGNYWLFFTPLTNDKKL